MICKFTLIVLLGNHDGKYALNSERKKDVEKNIVYACMFEAVSVTLIFLLIVYQMWMRSQCRQNIRTVKIMVFRHIRSLNESTEIIVNKTTGFHCNAFVSLLINTTCLIVLKMIHT